MTRRHIQETCRRPGRTASAGRRPVSSCEGRSSAGCCSRGDSASVVVPRRCLRRQRRRLTGGTASPAVPRGRLHPVTALTSSDPATAQAAAAQHRSASGVAVCFIHTRRHGLVGYSVTLYCVFINTFVLHVLYSYCICTVWVKKNPPTVFWNFFPNGWEFLINISHTYYAIISTLEYKFSFKYL